VDVKIQGDLWSKSHWATKRSLRGGTVELGIETLNDRKSLCVSRPYQHDIEYEEKTRVALGSEMQDDSCRRR
jgi:hypothetical protein